MKRSPIRSGSIRALSLALLACAVASCKSQSSIERHVEWNTWKAGWEVTASHPERWMPPAFLAAVTPIVWIADEDISEDSISQDVFNSNTKYGDAITVGFVTAPLLIGTVDACSESDSRYLEVWAEAFGLTVATTSALKLVVNRERPDGSGEDSFPSGHTSLSFAGATLLQRTIQDRAGEEWGLAAYSLYIPAAYVGITRLEGEKHYLADITFGAALGWLISNWVYDAHYGEGERAGIYSKSHASMNVFPAVSEHGIGIGLDISF